MSWANTIQDASFRGVPFEVFATSDQGGKDVAVLRRPYVNGGELLDMGNEPDSFDVQALLRGDDYEAQLADLIRALKTTGPGELVHPVFGSKSVAAVRWSIEHKAEARDSCEVAIKFIEAGTMPTVFAAPAASVSSERVGELGKQARAAAVDSVAVKVDAAAASSLPRVTEINAAFDQAKAKLRKLLDTTSVRVLMADLDVLLYPRAALNDLEVIVNGAFAGLPLGGINAQFNGPSSGFSLAAAVSDFDRLQLGQDPAITVVPVSTEPQDLDISAALTAFARVLNATTVATAATMIMAAEIAALELERAEIERLAAAARAALQLAINAARSALDGQRGAEVAKALATCAHEVQEAARAALELRPPVVTRVAPISGTARMLAHALYGDHTRAVELARLNKWGRLVFINAGQEIQAYAR